ncbi:MAG: SprB repeat-containing protein [Bacteroidota bacterium]
MLGLPLHLLHQPWEQSESLVTNLTAFDTIACFGDSTAAITALASGGTGDLNFSWNYPLIDDPTQLDQLPSGNYILSVEDELGCIAQDSIQISEPEAIILSTDITSISCAGDANGGINASLNGGTGMLDFVWSNGSMDTVLNNLAEGTYTITVTDENSCSLIDSVDLVAPLPLVTDSIVLQTVGCFGRSNGEAEVLVSGGTAPYNYNWLDSLNQITSRASNLPGGFVEVRITDQNGCLVTEILEIPEPMPLAIDFNTKDVECRGETNGLATAVVEGGTQPYNYNWQTGSQDTSASNLGVGSYTITVTDNNGCIINGTTSISEPSTDLMVSADQSTEGCFGEKNNRAIALVSGGGDAQYTYLWSDGQTTSEAIALDSIAYTVTVIDANGCSREASIDLADLPAMQPNMIISAPSCFGLNNGAIGINFVEGRPNANLNDFQFMWNTGQLGPTIGNLRGDSLYTVTVTDPSGCTAVESRFVRQPKLITF